MIIWLNGPFGVGKTQLAKELHTRLPGSFIFDPEEVGFALRKLIPPEERLEDFQDYPLWREMVAKTLLYSASSGVPLIVPMTLVNARYFEEVVGFLRAQGQVVHHVVLMGSREVILDRLERRGDGADSWAAGQLERCLKELSQFDPNEHVQTDDRTLSEVAEVVVKRLGLAFPRCKLTRD